jgi:hypothetical protein
MLARFCAAHDQFAPKEFFVVQFLNSALCFLDRLHLNKSKTFGALVVAITDYLGVLDVSDTVEELEQVALGRVEGKIPDVKPGRRNFDRLRFARWPRWRLAIPGNGDGFLFAFAIAEKRGQLLPECLFRGFGPRWLLPRLAIAPSVGTAARTPRTSPG